MKKILCVYIVFACFVESAFAMSYLHKENFNVIMLIEKSLYCFKNDIGRFPTTEEGIELLVHNSSNLKNWKGPYFLKEENFIDVWGKKYVYICPARYGNKAFDLYSFGKNSKDEFGGNDDISNWAGYDNSIYNYSNAGFKNILRVMSIIALGLLTRMIYRNKRKKTVV